MGRHSLSSEMASKMGRMGGRPKGVLSPKTIEKIKTQEAFVKVIQEKAGRIADNLLRGSDNLDTSASKELLERAFGKVPQGVNMKVAVFSLKDLHEHRERLRKGIEIPEEKETE